MMAPLSYPPLRRCLALIGLILLTGSAFQARSQPVSETPWEVVDRGLYFRVWQKTVTHTDPETGELKKAHRQYTELGNGLHYREDGQWKKSQDLVEVAEVGAVARKGPHQVIFSPNANAPVVIDHMTHDNKRFQSRVLGLYYFDAASGQSALLAPVQASRGRVLPPNQALYPDAFDELSADLLYTYTKSRFEQDVVLLEQPVSPAEFGFDPETTRLEVWTEFMDPPAPHKRVVTLRRESNPAARREMVEPDLIDEILFFGDTWFPVGTAFRFKRLQAEEPGEPAPIELQSPDDPGVLPIGKQWRQIDGRTVLIESVDYDGLLQKMAGLDQANADEQPEALQKRVAKTRQLPKKPSREAVEKPLLVAQHDYAPKGVALDYITESGTANSYTFTNGQTFFITNHFTVGPNQTTFEPGCVIKFAFGHELKVTGPYSFPDTDQTPIFTAKNDDGFGEDIDPSVNTPIRSASPAFWHYFRDQATTIKNARFRWALKGIEYDDWGPLTNTLKNTLFENSQTGVDLDSDLTLQLSNVTKCDIDTAISGGGSTQGSMTDALFCTTTNNFKGINQVDDDIISPNFPPDDHGAVGPSHFVEITNFKIVAFDRDDGARNGNETNTLDFFTTTVDGTQYPTQQAADPRIVYDHQRQAWAACAFDNGSSELLLAVKDSSNPLQLANWTKYVVPVETNGWLTDFPTLGVDENGLYVSVAYFSNGLKGNQIFAFEKPEIYQGGNVTNTMTNFWISPTNDVETHAIQPAVDLTSASNGDNAWFLAKGRSDGTGSSYKGGNIFYRALFWDSSTNRFKWADTNGWKELPTTSSDHRSYYDLDTARDRSEALNPPQKNMASNFDLNDVGSRLTMAFLQDDPGSSAEFLWTCQAIGLDGPDFDYDGNEASTNIDRTGVQWLKVKIDSSGTLDTSSIDFDRIRDDASNEPYWYYFPSLAVNDVGDMITGFSGSNTNEFIGAFYTGQTSNESTMNQPVLVEAGRDEFDGSRWGDYHNVALDPNGSNFWTVQQYSHWETNVVDDDFLDEENVWGT